MHKCAVCGREVRRFGRAWLHPDWEGLEPHQAVLVSDVELWERVRKYQEMKAAEKEGKKHHSEIPPPIMPAVLIDLDELHRGAKSLVKAAADWEVRAARSIGPWVSVDGRVLRIATAIQVAFKRDNIVASALWLSVPDPLLDSFAFEHAFQRLPVWKPLKSNELRQLLKSQSPVV